MKIQNYLVFLLCFLIFQISAQIKITENNSSRFSFAWNLDNYNITPVLSSGLKYSTIFFPDENTILGENGEVILPGYSFLLGIPGEGEVKVYLDPSEIKTISLDAPLERHKDFAHKRQSDVNFNNPWVCEPVYGRLQGIRTAQLIVRPFIYDEKTNTVKVMLKGSCSIEFPASSQAANSGNVTAKKMPMFSTQLVNYPVCTRWQSVKSLSRRALRTYPIKSSQKVYRFHIGDGDSLHNEMTTNENGILKIPGDSVIKYLSLSDVNIDDVVLYASFKGELPIEISDTGEIPAGLVEVPLLKVDKNGNRKIDSPDFILAFVTGASDWIYDQNAGDYIFKLDRYDDFRNYWLTTSSGKRLSIGKYHNPVAEADTSLTFDNKIIFSRNSQQYSESEGGFRWIWKRLNHDNSFTFDLNIPGLDNSVGGLIKIDYYSTYGGSIYAFIGDQLKRDSNYNYYAIKKWGDRTLRITETGSDTSFIELSNLEVHYKRKLTVDDATRKLEILSPAKPVLFNYKIKINTNDLLYIFRISNDEKQVLLIDTLRNAADKSFTISDTGGIGTRYMVCSEKSFTILPSPQKKESTTNSAFLKNDLRNTNDSTDYLIISATEFISAADKLAQHKKKMGFNAPRIVNVKEVYDEFSGGDVDPTAIRNFIAYVQSNWTRSQSLSYVLLFGHGHYDYKGVSSKVPVYLPVYYNESNIPIEDYFISRDGNNQTAIGRIPCKSEDEGLAVVKKIIEMEDPEKADFSDWRNRALFVADDDMQGSRIDGIAHYNQSDNVASWIEDLRPSIIMRKVYLLDYKWNTAGQKPEASKAIVNAFDGGVGLVNYFGHGSFVQWADEKVLLSTNVELMRNKNKYPLVCSFSCSVGRFDMPDVECLSSSIVKRADAGGIAAISSTRLAYASSNEALALSFYTNLFSQDSLYTIGMALCKAKSNAGNSYSSRSYSLLGDPSLIIEKPVRSINMEIKNKSGVKIDSIMAFQQISITGTINYKDGKIDSNFGTSDDSAYVHIGLFNVPEKTSRKDGGENLKIHYIMPGTAIFMGRTQVHNGKFQQSIQLPANLTFNKPGAKLTGYIWKNGGSSVGLGAKTNIIFSGTDPDFSTDDSVGPEISIKPVHEYKEMASDKVSFSGHVIRIDSMKCEVDLFDQSGIDVTGIGPDEGLTMEIEGVSMKQNINHKFNFNEGDYRHGSALIKELNIKPGKYTLNFTARDLKGNLSKESFKVEITEPQEFELDHVFNSPNPFRMGKGTKFYFFPTKTSYQTFAAVKIYTLSGRPVKVIKNAINGQFWDGRDQTGCILGPDIYLYQIEASAPDFSKKIKSKIKKLVINP